MGIVEGLGVHDGAHVPFPVCTPVPLCRGTGRPDIGGKDQGQRWSEEAWYSLKKFTVV